jgi:hypothetical protein
LAPLFVVGSAVAATTLPAAGAAAATVAPLPTATGAAGLAGTLTGAAPVFAAKLAVTQVLLWGALGLGVGITTTAATVVLTSKSPVDSPTTSAKAVPGRPIQGATRPVPARGGQPDVRTQGLSGPSARASVATAPTTERVRATLAEGEPGTARPAALTGRDERSERALSGPASTLAEETRLLRAAQAARREGRESLALELLEDHARRFPRGVLWTERSVTQALALCAQGQAEASNRLREQVLEQTPNVPAVSRIRTPCAAGQGMVRGSPSKSSE